MLCQLTRALPVFASLLFIAPAARAGKAPPPPPMVAIHSTGKLDKQTVRHYMQLHKPSIRHCYVLELGRRPRLRVTVAVKFTIGPTGQVSDSSAGKTALSRCVARSIRRINFPETFDVLADGSRIYGDPVTVNYRYRFRPKKRSRRRTGRSSPELARAYDKLSKALLPDAEAPRPPEKKRPAAKKTPPARAVAKPAQTAPAKAKPGSKPQLPLPRSGDPLEGIDFSR